jgi:azurin
MMKTTRREFLKSMAIASMVTGSAAVLAACGGGGATPAPAAAPVTLEIGSKGDELTYDKSELSAPAGAKITLKLKNNAASGGNKHNWILVKGGQADAVATDGIAAGEAAGYLKAGDNRVIAHTKLSQPGETVEVVFDAPPPGTYDFICTFPGHNVTMKGKLIIK